jgi:hypothetical protein
MYRGKDQERPADIPATVFPVIKLTANAMYHNKGYVLGTDNWYTQLMVLLKMMDIGIDIVGTVKANKKGLPKECMFPKKGRNVRLRGEMRSMTVAMPLRAGGTVPIYFTAWMDSKPVHMLSTFAPYQAECLRNRATAAGGHEKAPCPQPTVIPVYNIAMPGTDMKDQMNSYYEIRKRGWKWQPRIFGHFNNCSNDNACTLYNCHLPVNKKLTLLQFKMRLVLDWCTPNADDDVDSDGDVDSDSSSDGQHRTTSRVPWRIAASKHLRDRDIGKHTPQKAGNTGYSIEDHRRIDGRGRCVVCDLRTPFQCQECESWLCIDISGGKCCWSTFHGQNDFRKSKRSHPH